MHFEFNDILMHPPYFFIALALLAFFKVGKILKAKEEYSQSLLQQIHSNTVTHG